MCLFGLTDKDGQRLAADANTSNSHGCHLNLVKDTGHQAFHRCGQSVPFHCLVDVVACLVVVATAHTPNLLAYRERGVFKLHLLFCVWTFMASACICILVRNLIDNVVVFYLHLLKNISAINVLLRSCHYVTHASKNYISRWTGDIQIGFNKQSTVKKVCLLSF